MRNIRRSLAAFGIDDISEADLAARAEAHLPDIGMSREEIDALRDRPGTDII